MMLKRVCPGTFRSLLFLFILVWGGGERGRGAWMDGHAGTKFPVHCGLQILPGTVRSADQHGLSKQLRRRAIRLESQTCRIT